MSQNAPRTLKPGTRIVHVVRQFLPNRGGLEDVVAQLCRAQLAAGLQPSVVTLDRLFRDLGRTLPAQEVIDGIPVTRIPFRGSTRYPLAPSIFAHLGAADIVHVHAIDFFFDALAWGWPLHRKPLVATTHGGFFHTGDHAGLKRIWFNVVTRLSALAYRGIAACSASDAERFRSIAGSRVMLIENGVDLRKFAGAASLEPRKRLISLGRFSKNKRPDRLIETMGELCRRDPDWRLDLVGVPSDWTEPDLRAAIRSAGLQDAISLHLGPADAAVRALIGENSLFVSASEFEGFGLVLIEALSAGLLPVVQPNAAFTSLAAKLPAVRLADFADPAGAADAIEAALAALAAGQGAPADIARQIEPYSWDQVAQHYQALYTR